MKTHRPFFALFCFIGFYLLALPLARADELTLYIYPAPMGINWSSPQSLAWSALANNLAIDNELQNIHSIGHMNFDLSCGRSGDLPGGARFVTGQTNSDDSEMNNNIFLNAFGLGVFLASYSGRWETMGEIEADLPVRFKRGSIAFTSFQISPKTCARVVSYLEQYKLRGYDRIYGGLEQRPRYGEGGGCSAFAESVLEIAGLMAPEWKSYWSHFLYVPDDLIGGPMTGNGVSPFDLLFGLNSLAWNPSQKNSYSLSFFDPYYAYYWVEYGWRRKLKLTGMSYRPVTRGNARGLAIDATQVPTPTDPFWLVR
jgi:hypothetical protein